MKKLTAVIAILMTLNAFSQATTDANIYGHVVNAATGEHIADINIVVKGTALGTTSNESGHFLLNDLPAGEFTLAASGVGFKSEEKAVSLKKGTSLELTFSLEPDLVQLQSVVVSASRNEVNRKDASAIVNVINPKIFENTASSCLSQGLGFQPGIRVEMNCQNCGFQQVRLNGLDGAYTQLLIDSRPVFSSLAAVYGIEQIPANMIERVEVIRGGGSSLFGTNAIAGTINIITREPKTNQIEIGNHSVLIGGKSADFNTSMNASVVDDNADAGITIFGAIRDRQPFDANGDGFSEIGQLRSRNGGFKAFVKPGTYSKLNFEYHNLYEYRRGGNAFDKPLHEADIAEQAEHNINSGGLNYVLFSKNGRNKFNMYASAQMIHRNNYAGVEQDKNAYGTTKNSTIFGGIQYNYNAKKLLFMPAELTGGIEYLSDNLNDVILGYQHTTEQSVRIASAFFQNEWKTDRSGILLGVRLDKHNLIENLILSPRVSFRYAINDMITFRTGYSKGFRAPQVYDEDLHGSAIGGEISYVENNANLKPESSNSLSASFDFDKTFGKVQTELLVEGFFIAISDVFVMVEKGITDDGFMALQRNNGSGAKVRGLNVEAKAATAQGLVFQAGVTLQKSLYDEAQFWSDDETLPPQRKMFRSPDSYAYITADWNPMKKLEVSFTGNYTGKMLVQHFAGDISEDIEVTTPVFFDAGINLTYNLKIRKVLNAKASIGVKNILNSYQNDFDKGVSRDAGYIYGPIYPRTFTGGISFEI